MEASMLAMDVNDYAGYLHAHVVYAFIASMLVSEGLSGHKKTQSPTGIS